MDSSPLDYIVRGAALLATALVVAAPAEAKKRPIPKDADFIQTGCRTSEECFRLGEMRQENGQYPDAITFYDEARRLGSTKNVHSAGIRAIMEYNLAIAHLENGDPVAAQKALAQYLTEEQAVLDAELETPAKREILFEKLKTWGLYAYALQLCEGKQPYLGIEILNYLSDRKELESEGGLWTVTRHLAACHERARDYKAAIDLYRTYVAPAPEGKNYVPTAQRINAQKRIVDLKGKIDRQKARAREKRQEKPEQPKNGKNRKSR